MNTANAWNAFEDRPDKFVLSNEDINLEQQLFISELNPLIILEVLTALFGGVPLHTVFEDASADLSSEIQLSIGHDTFADHGDELNILIKRGQRDEQWHPITRQALRRITARMLAFIESKDNVKQW